MTEDERVQQAIERRLRHARIARLRKAEADRDPVTVQAAFDALVEDMDATILDELTKEMEAMLGRRWKWARPPDELPPVQIKVLRYNAILERDPAGSMFRPWNTPETLAKVRSMGESPFRCASTRPTPKPGT